MERYEVTNGKLVVVAKTKRTWKWLWRALFVLAAIGLSVMGYMLYTKQLDLPVNNIALTKQEHEDYLALKRAASLEHSEDPLLYELNLEQLFLLFNQTFPDIKISTGKKRQYVRSVAKWSSYYSMPPLLVFSIIWRESRFDESVVSSANARGPMQVIYKYHPEKLQRLNKGEMDLHDIDTGVHVGVQILREYFDRNDRDLFKALRAYVGGEHRTYATDILTRYFDARIYIEERLPK